MSTNTAPLSTSSLLAKYPGPVRALEAYGNVFEKLPAISIIHAVARGKIVGALVLTVLVLPNKNLPQQSIIRWVKTHIPKLRPIAKDKPLEQRTPNDLESYLSGHAVGACDAVAFDALVYGSAITSNEGYERAYVITIIALASLVALSRWVALKHDAADITRGAVLGLLIGSIAAIASRSFDP